MMQQFLLALFNFDCKTHQHVDQVVGYELSSDQFFINKKIGNLSDCQINNIMQRYGDLQ